MDKVIRPAPEPVEDRDGEAIPPMWQPQGDPISTTSSLPPKLLLSTLQTVLKENGCKYRSLEPFSFKCEKDDIRFQVDINQLPDHRDMNAIIIKRIAGNPWKYKELSNSIHMAFKS